MNAKNVEFLVTIQAVVLRESFLNQCPNEPCLLCAKIYKDSYGMTGQPEQLQFLIN
ncbi:MAG: hypothetical protein ACE5IW_09635 [bacterium]